MHLWPPRFRFLRYRYLVYTKRMKRITRITAIFVLLLALLPLRAGAADTQNFVIKSFEADYFVGRGEDLRSTMRVEETIVAEFPGFDQNHGILRAIPESYDGHTVNLKIEEVTDGLGGSWNYTSESQNDNLVLKIGDADRYVHGLQTFKIVYTLDDVTKNFDDRDELYWDVNGDQWLQTFESVTARIHMPEDLASTQTDQTCFAGAYNSTGQDCSITTNDGTTTVAFVTRPLQAGETLTFAIAFGKGTFAAYEVSASTIIAIVAAVVGLGVLPPVVALWVVIRNWRRYGRDPKGRGTIVPEYLPPKGVGVVASGVLIKERFEPGMISAQIIDLAVRHYVKIYEVKEKKLLRDKTTYEVELVRKPDDLLAAEKAVVDALFGSGANVGDRKSLSTLANKLYKKAQIIGQDVSKQLAAESYFRVEPTKAKRPYIAWGIVLAVVGFVFLPFTIGIGIAGVIVLIAAAAMPARTAKGVELRDYLYGLRDYMRLAEAERIKVLQSPHGSLTEKVAVDPNDKKQLVKLYEKLLPYAMLFGIEQDWAKQFADLYTEQPDWYSGSGAFHAAVFASSLHSFGAASTASFTPPSSSSSSGTGGGGFSGGGGGGGGGGGW